MSQKKQQREESLPKEEQKEENIANHPEEDEDEPQINEESLRKKKQVDMFKKYLQQTGIAMAFQVIFAEILDKKVDENKVYSYTAMRLRQIGEDLEKIKMSKK